MARLFITNRELELISDITKEVMKDMSGQAIYYFPVNYSKTNKDSLYQEAVEKIIDKPIYIHAVIEFKGIDKPQMEGNGLSKNYTLGVNLHKNDLDDKGITPKEGDYLQFDKINFEVKFVNKPELIYGQAGSEFWYALTCEQVDSSVFSAPKVYDPLALKNASVPNHFTQIRGTADHDTRQRVVDGTIAEPITGVKSSPFDDEVNNN